MAACPVSKRATVSQLLDFLGAELKPRLEDDSWRSAVEFLQSASKQKDKIRDLSVSEDDCSEAKRWLQWAKSHKKLKTVSAVVPKDILPSGFVGTLHDVRVFSRGPDDDIYDKNEELRKKVARGNCFLELTSPSQVVTFPVIYALKKFTGGLGDDDDRDKGDDFTWKMYFSKPLDKCNSVVCTSKANGEAAHLSALSIGGEVYLCGGSKNVHMLFRNKDDVLKYDPKETRYTVAREICLCVLEMLDSLSPERKQWFIEFLTWMRLTAVFEILNPDHPHVEDLSSLPAPKLKFITWTPLDLSSTNDDRICWLSPDISLEIARAFGLDTVDYTTIDISEVDDRMKKIRGYYNAEGEVLFFLDNAKNVVGMLKKKSVWYILVRAIREKVRYSLSAHNKEKNNFSLQKENQKIEKRINEIQDWLGLDDTTVKTWKILGTDFLKWSITQVQNNTISHEDLVTVFPVSWKRFLEENERTDKVLMSQCSSE